MKWPGRLLTRRQDSSRLSTRCTKTMSGTKLRRRSRYIRFSDEQVATTRLPAAISSATERPIVSSQPARSASVSGVPDAILATFSAGCRLSPSMKVALRAFASALPTAVFPQPVTPMTMKAGHFVEGAADSILLDDFEDVVVNATVEHCHQFAGNTTAFKADRRLERVCKRSLVVERHR